MDSAELLIREIIKEIDESVHHAWYKDEIIQFLESKLTTKEADGQ